MTARFRVVRDVTGLRVYRLAWVLDDGEDGAYVGEVPGRETRAEPSDPEERDCWLADRAAATASPDGRDAGGFFWLAHEKARTAARAVRAALKGAS